MLVMFGVGMHFSLWDLLAVRAIAVPGAILQIATATALSAVAARFWGWLLVEDLIMVLSLVLLPTLAPSLGG